MRIGEVATQAGVNVETLRYYERRGLLPEPDRSLGGHREYGDDAVRFVRAVKEAQSLGFSLSEIEDYLRQTRRAPGSASDEMRARIAAKIDELDEKIDELRTKKAALTRALDETWESLDRGTSNAAYLARGGRDPLLRPGDPLHVTNGESVAGTLRETGLGGVALSWDDVLHVGPLAFEPGESNRVRAAFLAAHGWGDANAIERDLGRRDALLDRAVREGHPIVLWFEHDLFDQLQLLQILSAIDAPRPGQVTLVQGQDYLGTLDTQALEGLWGSQRPVAEETLAAARRAWRNVCDGDLAAAAKEGDALPHLAAALRRLAEEREPLSRTKRQLLTAIAEGAGTPLEAFHANQAQEEAIFLGDTWAFADLHELAGNGLVTELPLPPPRGDYRTFTRARVAITDAGLAAAGQT
jgi:DNA-binding transcriptional MerR regulator